MNYILIPQAGIDVKCQDLIKEIYRPLEPKFSISLSRVFLFDCIRLVIMACFLKSLLLLNLMYSLAKNPKGRLL